MEQARCIAVSPRHEIRIAEEYAPLIDRAPTHDFVVRTIERREANGLPLMSAEIVIAGEDTRQRHDLARTYPVHFRKTYFPSSLRTDPRTEFERSQQASERIGLPPPIGFEPNVFRSCLIPGTPYARLSPFGSEPEESNLRVAAELPLATGAGLWRLLEEAAQQLQALHASGFSHGDMELHNLIVCPSPLESILVDFEASALESEIAADQWEERCARDFRQLWREAVFIQCALGRQSGDFARRAHDEIPHLFRDPRRFVRAIELRLDH